MPPWFSPGATNLNLNGNITTQSAITNLYVDVINPSMTATIAGNIPGSISNIVKSGLGTLIINGSFTGNLNDTGGNVGFGFDGDGTSNPQTLITGTLTISGPSVISVGRLGTTYAPLFPNAANKTIEITSLVDTGGFELTINNPVSTTVGAGFGGYGVLVDSGANFSTAQSYAVTTATASNVVQGLTLGGVLSGSFGNGTVPTGIIKQGNGTLVLANPNNTLWRQLVGG